MEGLLSQTSHSFAVPHRVNYSRFKPTRAVPQRADVTRPVDAQHTDLVKSVIEMVKLELAEDRKLRDEEIENKLDTIRAMLFALFFGTATFVSFTK